MNNKTALIFGSTGLIGNLLLDEIIQSDKYQKIKIFVRQPIEISHSKLEEFAVDFSKPETFSEQITGDDLFICLGTTIKKAGSVREMEIIDRELPVKLASIAFSNSVKRIAVVSSIGANPESRNYYLRIKGEMEHAIRELRFNHTAIVRPSILLGERKEKRASENAGKVLMKVFHPLLLGKMRKYRGIHGRDVAKAMIAIMQLAPGIYVFESDELQKMADQY